MGKAKSSERRGKPNTSPYHVFFQRELKRVKQENPNMTHKEAFKQAGLNWKNSPENPKNQQAGASAPSTDQLPAGSSEKAPQAPAAASLESFGPSSEQQAQTTPFAPSTSNDAKGDALAPPPKLPSPQKEQSAAANPQELPAKEHPASAVVTSADTETAETKPAETKSTEMKPITESNSAKANSAEGAFVLHADTSSGNHASNTAENQERNKRPGVSTSGISSMAAHSVSGTLTAAK
ncbi:hypothetical protein IWW36_004398 [Coemansia brasiliensis]|uniref:YABBY protein C-terminal domain-containing protein n=1 Tax=Coemansia brasiliensis TaxID=2650707 RepID=A0A9W8I3N1_9FUNG|nr:hypothetical protein IWW36_004398 [Coemansia brasiliensis]